MAGRMAIVAMVAYGWPVYSAIRNAAAPMMGGMICPPVDAAASTAAANSGRYPIFFIIGIVIEPDPTVLATDDPEAMPSSADATTATLAGPPVKRPTAALANRMKKSATPVRSRNAPKMMKRTMNLAHVLTGVPKMPFVV